MKNTIKMIELKFGKDDKNTNRMKWNEIFYSYFVK